MTKQLLLFMTAEDERAFSRSLKDRFPSIVFLDANVWDTPQPVTAASIDLCKSTCAHLWNKELFSEIPIGPRPGGRFQGPGSGPVMQFLRSMLQDNVLRSGRIALGFNEEDLTPEVNDYWKSVWRLIKKPATSKLICVSPETGELINPKVWGYWAWPNAVAWCRAEKGRFLRDRATQNFYLPA